MTISLHKLAKMQNINKKGPELLNFPEHLIRKLKVHNLSKL